MKRLIINLFALVALLSVGVINFSAVTLAQDAPPALVDPFASDPDPVDDAPPALTLPPVEEPAAVEEAAAEPDPVVPAAEEPAEEEAPPALTLPAAEEPVVEEPAPVEELHSAAPAPSSAYSGGSTANSGPGLAIIGLGSLLGAAVLRRRKK